jgi:hypothetical protein
MPLGNIFHSFGRPVRIPGTLLDAAGQLVASDSEYASYVAQIGDLIPPTHDPLLPADLDVLVGMLVRIASRPSTIAPVVVGIISSETKETYISAHWERDPERQEGYDETWEDNERFMTLECCIPIEFRRILRHVRAFARLMRMSWRRLKGDTYFIIPRGFALRAPNLSLH